MAFEVMGAVTNLGKLIFLEEIKDFINSIPDFFRSANSYLPENRAIRVAVYGTGVCCIIQLLPYILRHTEMFDYYYRYFGFIHRFCPFIEKQKHELFQQLKKDADILPKNSGELTVLELQAGGGSNLTFYPEGTQLVATDFDGKYEEQMLQNFDNEGKLPLITNVTLHQFINTHPEELKGVPDHSISAVICIHALCLPLNLDRTFCEIKRVLMPKGRVYFIEHTAHEGILNWKSFQQIRMMPAFAMTYCHLRRNLKIYVERAGFSEVYLTDIEVDFSKAVYPVQPLAPHVFGYCVY